jgi:predicted ATPase
VLQPLLGREDDMAAMGTLIGQHRLITIVAAGGMGKTRLTQWLLAERRTAYADGVCWVELAGLSDPGLVVSTIACSMGIQLEGDDPLSGLVAALEGLSILMAIDNAEHLIDETARVVQTLMQKAPQLSLLVTSQMPLKCSGERVYRLGPLGLPDEPVGAEEALTFGAVALFVDCARAADRHFELTRQNVDTVVEICRNLDGMALAIELAAARVQLLGLARLSVLLNERLRLLTGGNRTAPQRHQTLRAALEWSHALLSPVEQTVFRRLGVFVGGFDLDVAQQVVAVAENDALEDLGIDPWTVVDALGGLVDRSMVAVDAGEPPRYRLLMSARSYALERLTAAEETMRFRARHSRALLDRFIAVNADCWTGRIGVDAAVDWLDQDIDNGREALNWALQHSPLDAVAAASAMELALTYDRRLELRAVWEATAQLAADGIPELIRADWLLGCARFWAVEQPDVGARWASEAITLARATGDSVTLYQGLVALCFSDFATGRSWTQDRVQEFLDLERPGWSARLKSRGAQAQYVVVHTQGQTADAKDALDRCVQLGRESGCSDTIFMGLCNLADVLLAGGDVDGAVRIGREAVREATINRRNRRGICAASVNLTGALLAQGALDEARMTAEEAWPMAKAFLRLSWMVDYVSLLAALEGRFRDAALLCGAANSLYAARGCAREVNEAQAARRAAALARDHLGDSERLRLQDEGASLCDSDLAQAAFGWNKG